MNEFLRVARWVYQHIALNDAEKRILKREIDAKYFHNVNEFEYYAELTCNPIYMNVATILNACLDEIY